MLDAKPTIAVALPNSSKNWMKRKLSIHLKNIVSNFLWTISVLTLFLNILTSSIILLFSLQWSFWRPNLKRLFIALSKKVDLWSVDPCSRFSPRPSINVVSPSYIFFIFFNYWKFSFYRLRQVFFFLKKSDWLRLPSNQRFLLLKPLQKSMEKIKTKTMKVAGSLSLGLESFTGIHYFRWL